MTDRQLLQQALDALCVAVEPKKGKVYAREFEPIDCYAMHEQAITALRERRAQPEQEPDPIGDAQDRLIAEMAAQPEQEPVAENFMDALKFDVAARDAREWDALYTTPPAAQRT